MAELLQVLCDGVHTTRSLSPRCWLKLNQAQSFRVADVTEGPKTDHIQRKAKKNILRTENKWRTLIPKIVGPVPVNRLSIPRIPAIRSAYVRHRTAHRRRFLHG